ncbi:MAG: hypothetical protein ACR2H5_22760 [Ktedonobacteraceae bacterium]
MTEVWCSGAAIPVLIVNPAILANKTTTNATTTYPLLSVATMDTLLPQFVE